METKEPEIQFTCVDCTYHVEHSYENCFYEPKPIWRKASRPACHNIQLTQKAKGE